MVFADKIAVLSLMYLVVPSMSNMVSLFKKSKTQVRMVVLPPQNYRPIPALLSKRISQTTVPLSALILALVSSLFVPIKSKISDTLILNGSQTLIIPRNNVAAVLLVGTKMMAFSLVDSTRCHLH